MTLKHNGQRSPEQDRNDTEQHLHDRAKQPADQPTMSSLKLNDGDIGARYTIGETLQRIDKWVPE